MRKWHRSIDEENSPDPQKKDISSLNDVGFQRAERETFSQPRGFPRMRREERGAKFFRAQRKKIINKLGFLQEPRDLRTRSPT